MDTEPVPKDRGAVGVADEQLVPRAVARDEAALTALLEGNGAQVRSALQRSYRGRLKWQVEFDIDLGDHRGDHDTPGRTPPRRTRRSGATG